jgi:DNA-binding NarL/FixJ family response regulator
MRTFGTGFFNELPEHDTGAVPGALLRPLFPAPRPVDSTPQRIRLLVVDDHALLREGVAAVIGKQADLELVGEAGSGEEALQKFRELRPDVTLMDLQMPGIGGLEAIARIRAEAPQARIVVLTTYGGDVQAMRALKAGAAGYLLKNALRRELIDTIRAVHGGQRSVAPAVAEGLLAALAEAELTQREIDVLQRVAQGSTNRQVADALSVSEEAIKARMKSILGKLNANDRAHAVSIGIRRGFIRLMTSQAGPDGAGSA